MTETKTKLTQIFNGDYRVLWKNGNILSGYKDFTTKRKNYISYFTSFDCWIAFAERSSPSWNVVFRKFNEGIPCC